MSLKGAVPLVLVGAGKMGGAMLARWLNKGISTEDVVIVDPALANEAAGHITSAGLVRVVGDASDIDFVPSVVVLAVKPQSMDKVLPKMAPILGPDTVTMSVAAGTTIAALEKGLGSDRAVVRVMPNTPAQVGRGMSAAFGNPLVTDEHRHIVTELLNAIGESAWLDDEGQIDAVTAVSGSGPAYVFLLAEVLGEAAKAIGLPKDLAEKLARVTVSGAGELLHQSPLTPDVLRVNVTSPGGTTAAALAVLMGDDALKSLMTRAVAAAEARAIELGQ